MITNYLKIAWRNIVKNKTFSAINIFGLSIGIAVFLLIANYLRFEYSYDNFHVNKDRIYRVPMELTEQGEKTQTFAFTYPAVAPGLKKDFPEVEEAVRMRRQSGVVYANNKQIVEDESIYYVDPAFLKLFSFEFKEGQSESVFSEHHDAVITEATAKKYFGTSNVVGNTLRFRNENYFVKAVLKDIPGNSQFRFNILFNYKKYVDMVRPGGSDAEGSWTWSDFYTYILLKTGTNAKALEEKLPAFTERYLGSNMKERGYKVSMALQPLKDIHLRSKYGYELAGNGNLNYLKYLGFAALFILFIAWINYINLSTARSLERSREVGVRKVVGANKFQLIRQFLVESSLINIIAILIAIFIFYLSLPYFSNLVQKNVADIGTIGIQFWIYLSGIFLVGMILSGFYPAFVLSSFQPIQTLKQAGGFSGQRSKNTLRKSLVILQFVAAIILVTGSIAFYRQLHFMSQRDLGVQIDQTLVLQQKVNQDSSKLTSIQSFFDQVQSVSGVKTVSASTDVPGSEVGSSASFNLRNSDADKRCRLAGIDNNFIPSYGLTLLAGRNFNNDQPPVDTAQPLNLILNETAIKMFGFIKPADAIGQALEGAGFRANIVGVIKDYHQESLQHSFDPIVFYPEQQIAMSHFSLKLQTSNISKVMSQVKAIWNARFPESPFQYFFLDDYFDQQYRSDRLFSTVLWLFTIIAIIIASLGLFGLSLYMVTKRSKEISIRKVLGATILQITTLITSDYLKLILYAGIVAIPVAWYLLNNWLNDYAFHITIGWWFFLLPLMVMMLIAVITILYQSVKAALSNPVKNLRTE